MFNPEKHLSTIKTKRGPAAYLRVQWRLVWFREACPHGQLTTELVKVDLDAGYAIFKATVTDEVGGQASGFGSETRADFDDYSQFVGEDEFNEGTVVDSPVAIAS